jgi:hypothetical protein
MTDDLSGLELAIQENPIVVLPLTGQLVDLTKPTEVADALATVRDAKRQLDEIRADLEAVLVLESTRQGTKTLHLGDRDAVISGGTRTDYDALQLTLRLAAAGLPEDRLSALIVTTVSYRVDQRVAKQLSAANPVYAEILDQCRTIEPAPWRVTLK